MIDRCYPFKQIADAHRYVDTRRKRGSVVITIRPETGHSNAHRSNEIERPAHYV